MVRRGSNSSEARARACSGLQAHRMRCSGATALQPPTMVLEFLARQLPCHESYDSIAAIGTAT